MKPVQIIFTRDVTFRRLPDSVYEAEYDAALNAGISCCLMSYEDLEAGTFKAPRDLVEGIPVIYRGWMMPPERYQDLYAKLQKAGSPLLTTPDEYRASHHLPGWYEKLKDLTPATLILPEDADLGNATKDLDWKAFFVKDFVKSAGGGRSSATPYSHEIREILADIIDYRGELEGGICIREFEDFVPDTEQRFFVYKGNAYANTGEAPEIVHEVARRLPQPFFSVDVVLNTAGQHRVVEVGDGQVSDTKHWSAERMIEILAGE
jgi:hypothetical protein